MKKLKLKNDIPKEYKAMKVSPENRPCREHKLVPYTKEDNIQNS
jgi:hypothetical protein